MHFNDYNNLPDFPLDLRKHDHHLGVKCQF
jgi:hypothetical protein